MRLEHLLSGESGRSLFVSERSSTEALKAKVKEHKEHLLSGEGWYTKMDKRAIRVSLSNPFGFLVTSIVYKSDTGKVGAGQPHSDSSPIAQLVRAPH